MLTVQYSGFLPSERPQTNGISLPILRSKLQKRTQNQEKWLSEAALLAACSKQFAQSEDTSRGTHINQWFPITHQYLREMNKQVLSQYDILTVGETPLVTPYEGILYSHPDRHELGMIFQFEHMDLDKDPETGGPRDFKLSKLKEILNRWQTEVYGNGWNSNYWSNHDQARAVSRFGDDGQFRVQSAKMLGTTLHMMFGTPYIFQGEELGLINTVRQSIEEYNDLYDHHKYDILINELGLSNEEAMRAITPFSRDNARVPMSWSCAANGGFTTGKPWLACTPDTVRINAEQALQDPNSVYFHYQKLIRLRRNSPYSSTIVYGQTIMILPEDEALFAYIRQDESAALLVVSNFTAETIERSLDYSIQSVVLSNYDNSPTELKVFMLRPYESIVYELAI
jgi:glycosidase